MKNIFVIKYIKKIIAEHATHAIMKDYYRNFEKSSFIDKRCESPQQFEASITRLYHTIEKGLSYTDYRAGFGRENIESLLVSMEQYCAKEYDINAFFYETALSCLKEYIRKNKEYGLDDTQLEKRIESLPGKENNCGGTITVSSPKNTLIMNYEELIRSRHSIRHYSKEPVDLETLESAIKLAQFTPSACNRQGWRTIIVSNKEKITEILANQNGNRGFGNEIDKLLVITADLRSQQKNREIFQAFIDGGMYAESVLNCLFYKGIGSIPLSASLTLKQEKNIRNVIGISDEEVMILFIGVGNYPEGEFLTTRSERKPIDITVL